MHSIKKSTVEKNTPNKNKEFDGLGFQSAWRTFFISVWIMGTYYFGSKKVLEKKLPIIK